MKRNKSTRNPKRDAEIFRRYQAGETHRQIGCAFGMSGQRIAEIISQQSAEKGRAPRPPLPRECYVRRIKLTADVVRDFEAGTHSVQELAARLHCNAHYLRSLLRRAGFHQPRRSKFGDAPAEAYRLWMAGESMEGVSAKFGFLNVRAAWNAVTRYRRAAGLPGKREAVRRTQAKSARRKR